MFRAVLTNRFALITSFNTFINSVLAVSATGYNGLGGGVTKGAKAALALAIVDFFRALKVIFTSFATFSKTIFTIFTLFRPVFGGGHGHKGKNKDSLNNWIISVHDGELSRRRFRQFIIQRIINA